MYEITLISKTEEEDKIKKLIVALDGKIVTNSALGRRKLAYPIKKETAGYYFDYLVEMEGEKINELNGKLRMEDDIIRYLITQKRERVIKIKPSKKIKDEKAAAKATIEEPIVAEKIAETSDKKTQEISEPEKVATVTAKTKTPKTITKKIAPAKATVQKPKLKEIEVTEDERLKALEDKLSELLKD